MYILYSMFYVVIIKFMFFSGIVAQDEKKIEAKEQRNIYVLRVIEVFVYLICFSFL